jgi:Carboxypeptidase regulatory-like domain
MRKTVLLSFVLVLLLALSGTVQAQSATGQITGTVKDASGALVPNAKVTLTNQQTGLTRDTHTSETGSYTFPLLAVGVYSVSAEQQGFRTAKQSDIQLNVDQVARIDLDLTVGATSDTVNVEATAVNLDTENAAVGQVVAQKQITELPLNGRNFLQLLFIGNGAVETGGEQGSMRQGAGDAISINGSRPTSNNYMLDGTTNTDTSLNTPAVILSVDAIQEFKEQTANYSAEYGFSANQINIISKSGTNDLHGALFWFDRNNAFDARSYFQAAIPALRQNQYGFVVGGPVYIPKLYHGRNKTFWLVNWEATKIRQGTDFFANVPTASMLAGNFNTAIIDPTTGQPFPNNTVPSNRLARLSKVALDNHLFPAPNIDLPQGNYRATIPLPLDTNQVTYRMDQSLGKFGTVFARGTLTHYTNTSSGGITTLGDVFFLEDSTNWQVTHTVNVGPHLVNQFRLGFLEATANQYGVAAPQSAVDAIGLTGVFQKMPDIQRTWPLLGMTGYAGVGGAVNAYQASNQPMWDMSDSLNIIRGKHTFTVGANYRRWKLNRDLANNFLGVFSYSGFATGNPVADMLLGYYQQWQSFQPTPLSTGAIGNPRQFNFQYFAPYFQDDWKMSPNLTVNVGLRWDFRTVPYETNNHMGWWDVTNKLGGMCIADQSLVTKGIAPDGNGFYRYCGSNRPIGNPLTPFAPRLGFAYRPFGGDKTVVRGGYGIFWDSAEGREIDGSADIYPYVSRGAGSQTANQATPLQTTDSLFPNFTNPGPVTPAANSFLAVNISEAPRNPYVQQWSLSIQRQLSSNTKLEVNYIGNKGTHLLMRRNFAQALVPTAPVPADIKLIPTVAQRKPYPQFGIFINSDWSGNSSYQSGNVKIEHRAGNLLFTSAYTWAKSIDNKSAAAGIGGADTGWQGFIDNHNVRLDHGLSDFNVDHRLVSSFVYNLPFGRGQKYASSVNKAADAVIGGWQTNGIVTFQRGFPYSIYAQDLGGLLDDFSNRANLVGNPRTGFTQSIAEWFNTGAFAQPPAGVVGNAGRNILRAPGINNWDASLFKNFNFRERLSMQMRLESFNAFNHTQWGGPDHNTSSPQFGQITGARAGRINQVGLKVLF